MQKYKVYYKIKFVFLSQTQEDNRRQGWSKEETSAIEARLDLWIFLILHWERETDWNPVQGVHNNNQAQSIEVHVDNPREQKRLREILWNTR